jgi:hypothetical protein
MGAFGESRRHLTKGIVDVGSYVENTLNLTSVAVHKILHAADLIWQRLATIGCCTVYPIVKECRARQ